MTDKSFNPDDSMAILDSNGRLKCGCGSIISTMYLDMKDYAFCPICSKNIWEWIKSLKQEGLK